MSHEELSNISSTLEETLSSTKADLDKQRALNERLENDLLHINNAQRERETSAQTAGSGPQDPSASASGLSGLDLGSKGATVSLVCAL